MEQEIWKDIKDCDRYEVSSNGNLRHKHDKSDVQEWSFRGYRMATLTTNIGRRKQFGVHRIVASAFIDNPFGKALVNHKNAIRTDNRVENLEWVTASENLMHARKLATRKPIKPKRGSESPIAVKVLQYSIDGEFISEYGSMIDAENASGVSVSGISRCCSGHTKTSGGFIWKRKNA